MAKPTEKKTTKKADKPADPNRNENAEIKKIEFEGYKFEVDTDLIDDVEAFEYVDLIENKGQIAAIVPLLHYLIGAPEYEKMKAYFTEKEGKFRVTKLTKIYEVIIEKFDPKD